MQRPRKPHEFRVLIIEDDEDQAECLREVLEAEGWTVAVRNDGTAGLKAATEERPDAVVCDFRLPGMDGLELARRLRQRTPALPIVMITAYPEWMILCQADGNEVSALLTKPIDFRRLSSLIREMTGRAES